MFFMKDILVVVIRSIFQFILNPASWNRYTATTQNPQHEVPRSQHQVTSGVDIKDVNLGKALDLANSKFELMLTESAISAAIKGYLPPPSIQRTSSTEGESSVMPLISQNKASDASSSTNSFKPAKEEHLESSGIECLATNHDNSSDSSTSPTSESESYEEITYDELVSATAVETKTATTVEPLLVEGGQASLGDELVISDDGKSSKSSSCSTLPSDIELLNGEH